MFATCSLYACLYAGLRETRAQASYAETYHVVISTVSLYASQHDEAAYGLSVSIMFESASPTHDANGCSVAFSNIGNAGLAARIAPE